MLVTHSWNSLGVGYYSSQLKSTKCHNSWKCFAWQPVPADHDISCLWSRWDETLVTDSDPIIGSWLGGEGGWAVDVVSEMGLSRLIYFNVINWEDHILVGAGVGPGHQGRGTPGKWSANVTTGWVITGMAGSLVWWVLSPCPQFLPRCLPQFQDATSTCHQPFLSRWHNVGVIPAQSRGKQANWSLTDFRADWPHWQPAQSVESGWVWCRDCVNLWDVNCQLKLLFLSKKLKCYWFY